MFYYTFFVIFRKKDAVSIVVYIIWHTFALAKELEAPCFSGSYDITARFAVDL